MRDTNWNLIETGEEISGNYYVKSETISKGDRVLGSAEIFISSKFMRKKLRSSTVNILVTLVILDVLLVFILFVGIGKSVTDPVSRLAGGVRVIASGQLDREIHPEG